ncbi:MAG: protein kinase [Acidimicrobiales bacterium]|nr:protein kinase [Acidimicrobiales bacterium]
MTRIQTIETDSPRIVRLGEGGFGTTYRLSAGPNRPVVVLKLMPHGGLRARLSARLERELGTIAALSHHDDMVTIAGWGRRDDRWYVAFEEAAGGSLARLVASGATLEWRSVVRLGVRLAKVLELAHQLGVLHRDVKPANILLSADGRPMLSDLGLGTLACSFSLGTAAAADSLAVAAPEASRTTRLTPQADVYALAATLRLLLGGRGRSRADAPDALFGLLDEATARRPQDRHPSMASLRADLELLDDRRRRPLRIVLPAGGASALRAAG